MQHKRRTTCVDTLDIAAVDGERARACVNECACVLIGISTFGAGRCLGFWGSFQDSRSRSMLSHLHKEVRNIGCMCAAERGPSQTISGTHARRTRLTRRALKQSPSVDARCSMLLYTHDTIGLRSGSQCSQMAVARRQHEGTHAHNEHALPTHLSLIHI